MTNHDKAVIFNELILNIGGRELSLQDPKEFLLSLHQLREEIDEIQLAYGEGDLAGVVDGLVDLDFFQKGMLHKMGITEEKYDKCFDAVYDANMKKKLGTKEGRHGYGQNMDAVKPEGWAPPEELIKKILEEE